MGEAVKDCPVKKDAALTAAAVIVYCKANLTAYKVPKQVEFRDRLPKYVKQRPILSTSSQRPIVSIFPAFCG